jgi:hypothetical protein
MGVGRHELDRSGDVRPRGAGKAAGTAGADAPDVPLTEELLDRLLSATDPERYLESAPVESRDLSEYLRDLLAQHGRSRSDVIRGSDVNATFAYQIFQGARRPGRDTTIRLAFGLGCDLRETQRLLTLADNGALWPRRRRDATIIFCLEHGLSLMRCNEELYRLGEPILGEE